MLSALAAKRSILRFLSPLKTILYVFVSFGELTPIHTVPTGFASLPPPGPAIPEVGRIREQYRLMIMVKIEPASSASKIKMFLKETFTTLHEDEKYRNVRIFCDVDP